MKDAPTHFNHFQLSKMFIKVYHPNKFEFFTSKEKHITLQNGEMKTSLKYNFENFCDLKAWLDKLPEEKLVVGLYVFDPSTSQDEWLNSLVPHLRKYGFATVGIVDPSQAQCVELSQADTTALITAAKIHKLERINVFILSDHDCHISFPYSSRILACCHATYEKHETYMPCDGSCFATVDSWLCSYPLQILTFIP